METSGCVSGLRFEPRPFLVKLSQELEPVGSVNRTLVRFAFAVQPMPNGAAQARDKVVRAHVDLTPARVNLVLDDVRVSHRVKEPAGELFSSAPFRSFDMIICCLREAEAAGAFCESTSTRPRRHRLAATEPRRAAPVG